MSDLEDIVGNRPAGVGDGLRLEEERGAIRWNSFKKKRLRDSGFWGSDETSQTPLSGPISEKWRDESEIGRQQADGRKQDVLTTDQENHQAQFYEDYRRAADEYDKEFLRKYNDDLNTTLIFAGLLSVVISAFILELGSQLQPNPNEETATLLRVLIYKTDNTTFGNNVPTLPQWTGPPPTTVHVQAILYASLASSLLSAFLATLCKQWLNRYASTDKRGLTIEYSQNRQRKLDGITEWYFDFVMESLPLMVQAALLLLGCALSLYLWQIDIVIASVVLGITLFGVLFYFLVVIAGTFSDGCPYQTPTSRVLRYLAQHAHRTISSTPSAIRNTFEESEFMETVATNAKAHDPWWSRDMLIPFLKDLFSEISRALFIDVYRLGRAGIQALFVLPVGAYRLVRRALRGIYTRGIDQPTAALDIRCVSWTLRTSLEKPVHHSTLKHLVTIPELPDFDPTLVTDCFDVFIGCVSLSNHKVATIQGSEQLARMSAGCFFRTFHRLSVTSPTSSVLTYVRSYYDRVFPLTTDFKDLPFRHTMTMIHALVTQHWNPCHIGWDDDRPSSQEHISFARHMVEAAQAGYQQIQPGRVPRWILRFVLDSLSLDPPPPVSVVADCLAIAAIDLGCDVSSIMTLEISSRVDPISIIIIRKLEQMATAIHSRSILSEYEAVCSLFPYAVRLEQDGQQSMAEAILRVLFVPNPPKSAWEHVGPHIVRLLGKSRTPSLHHAIPFIFPDILWDDGLRDGNTVVGWDAAALADPYTERAGQDVVNLLLQIAYVDSLRPHIPLDIWAWLKMRPSLPPMCKGRLRGTAPGIVRHIRGLEDIEILKSYFIVVWSEWDSLYPTGLDEMEILIREDFGRTGMGRHRKDLIEHLDHVLGQLERRSPQIPQGRVQRRKEQYGRLRAVLVEVERER